MESSLKEANANGIAGKDGICNKRSSRDRFTLGGRNLWAILGEAMEWSRENSGIWGARDCHRDL
jgi:hypothetical protein